MKRLAYILLHFTFLLLQDQRGLVQETWGPHRESLQQDPKGKVPVGHWHDHERWWGVHLLEEHHTINSFIFTLSIKIVNVKLNLVTGCIQVPYSIIEYFILFTFVYFNGISWIIKPVITRINLDFFYLHYFMEPNTTILRTNVQQTSEIM